MRTVYILLFTARLESHSHVNWCNKRCFAFLPGRLHQQTGAIHPGPPEDHRSRGCGDRLRTGERWDRTRWSTPWPFAKNVFGLIPRSSGWCLHAAYIEIWKPSRTKRHEQEDKCAGEGGNLSIPVILKQPRFFLCLCTHWSSEDLISADRGAEILQVRVCWIR